MVFNTANSTRATLNSTGLAVTGTLTTTGVITVTQTAAPHYDFTGNWTVANHANPYIANVSGVGMTLGTYKFQIITNAANSTGVDFLIDHNGNAGLGTSTLTAAAGLAIKKNGDNLYLEQSNADNGWIIETSDSTGHLSFQRRGEGGSPSNTERMVMTTAGNVGIGTAPVDKLDVDGTIQITRSGSKYVGTSATAAAIAVGTTGGAQIEFEASGNDDKLHLITHKSGVGHARRLTVDENGNVGIGTTAPDQKLTVGGHILLVGGDADNAVKYSIIANEHYDTDDEEWPMISGWSQAASHTLALGGFDNAFNAATEIKFYTAANVTTRTGSERMTIFNNGYVGIGTGGTADHELHVENSGTNSTPAIKLENDAQGYRLQVNGGDSDKFQLLETTGYDSFLQFAPSTKDVTLGVDNNIVNLKGHVYIDNYLQMSTANSGAANKIHVNNSHENAGSDATIEVYVNGRNSSDAGILFATTYSTNVYWKVGIDQSNSKYFTISNNGTFGTNDYFTIGTNGNVGINVTSPSAKLHVSGSSYFTNGDMGVGGTAYSGSGKGRVRIDGNGDNAITIGSGTLEGTARNESVTFLEANDGSGGSGLRWLDGSGNVKTIIYGSVPSNSYAAPTHIWSSGNISFYPGMSAEEFRFETDGDFHADGDVYAFSGSVGSDIALKENINVIDNALDKVSQLKGVSFDWKRENKGSSAGLIAQDVEKVLPELVTDVDNLNDDGSYKYLNYNGIIGLLVESIKELKDEIRELKNADRR